MGRNGKIESAISIRNSKWIHDGKHWVVLHLLGMSLNYSFGACRFSDRSKWAEGNNVYIRREAYQNTMFQRKAPKQCKIIKPPKWQMWNSMTPPYFNHWVTSLKQKTRIEDGSEPNRDTIVLPITECRPRSGNPNQSKSTNIRIAMDRKKWRKQKHWLGSRIITYRFRTHKLHLGAANAIRYPKCRPAAWRHTLLQAHRSGQKATNINKSHTTQKNHVHVHTQAKAKIKILPAFSTPAAWDWACFIAETSCSTFWNKLGMKCLRPSRNRSTACGDRWNLWSQAASPKS